MKPVRGSTRARFLVAGSIQVMVPVPPSVSLANDDRGDSSWSPVETGCVDSSSTSSNGFRKSFPDFSNNGFHVVGVAASSTPMVPEVDEAPLTVLLSLLALLALVLDQEVKGDSGLCLASRSPRLSFDDIVRLFADRRGFFAERGSASVELEDAPDRDRLSWEDVFVGIFSA